MSELAGRKSVSFSGIVTSIGQCMLRFKVRSKGDAPETVNVEAMPPGCMAEMIEKLAALTLVGFDLMVILDYTSGGVYIFEHADDTEE